VFLVDLRTHAAEHVYRCSQGERCFGPRFRRGEPIVVLETTADKPSIWLRNVASNRDHPRVPLPLPWPPISPSGELCMASDFYGSDVWRLWNLRTGEQLATFPYPPSWKFTFVEQLGLVVGQDWRWDPPYPVFVWSAADGRLLNTWDFGHSPGMIVAGRETGLLALVSSRQADGVNKTLFVRADSGAVLGETVGHPQHSGASQTFSPHDRWFASVATRMTPETGMDTTDNTIFLTDLAPLHAILAD
jgi:hypothetical protein